MANHFTCTTTIKGRHTNYNLTVSSITPQIKLATRVQCTAALDKLIYIFKVVIDKQIPCREFKKW